MQPGNLPVLFLAADMADRRHDPNKGLREVAGLPLVARTIRAARAAAAAVPGGPHSVVCPTDDPAIAACAVAWHAEVPWLRPTARTSNGVTSVDAVLHAVDALAVSGRRFRAVVLLQPTSPLTEAVDIAAAMALFDEDGSPVAAITPTHPLGWHQAVGEHGVLSGSLGPEAATMLSGAIFVISPDELRSSRSFVIARRTRGIAIPPERSVDVEDEADLAVADALARARPVRTFEFADRHIGDGSCLVIAEAGVNHNGDPLLAHQLVDAAADAGADVVKFQTFDPDRLAAAGAPTAAYQRAAGEAGGRPARNAGTTRPSARGLGTPSRPMLAIAASSSSPAPSTRPPPTFSSSWTCPPSRSAQVS